MAEVGLVSIFIVALTLISIVSVCALPEQEAQAKYDQGADLAVLGQYSQAIGVWQELQVNYKDQSRICANAKLSIGKALHSLNQTDAAVRELSDLVATSTEFHRQSAEALLEMGRIFEESGNLSQALAKYQEILSNHPDEMYQCAVARLRRAACSAAQGDSDKEFAELEKLTQAYPSMRNESAAAALRIGQIYVNKGQCGQAIAQFPQFLATYGDMPLWRAEARLWLGAAQRKSGQLDEALASYKSVLTDHPSQRPQCVKALLEMGSVYEQQGDYEKAASQYGEVIRNHPKLRSQMAEAKARVDVLIQSPNLSSGVLEELQNAVAVYDQAKDGPALETQDQRITELTGLAADYPILRRQRFDAIMNKGRALSDAKQHDLAIAELRKALTEYDDQEVWTAQALVALGRAQLNAGHLNEALDSFRKVLAEHASCQSECVDAMLFKGKTYEKLRQKSDAIAEYNHLLNEYANKFGRASDAAARLSNILHKSGQHADADTVWEQLMEHYSTDRYLLAELLLPKGTSEFKTAQYAASARTLRKLLADHPNEKTARLRAKMLLLQALVCSSLNEEALALLSEMRQDSAYSRIDQGYIALYTTFCYLKNDPEKAEEMLTSTINEYPDTDPGKDAYFHRALCRVRRGAYTDALIDINRIEALYLKHYAMGVYYNKQRDFARAAQEYEQVVPNLPADFQGIIIAEPAESLKWLVQYYGFALGDKEKAKETRARLDELVATY